MGRGSWGEVHVGGGGSCCRRGWGRFMLEGVHDGGGRFILEGGEVHGGKFMMEEETRLE